MKQKKFMPKLLMALMSVSLLGGCDFNKNPEGPSETETIQYDIKFVNYDGTTLQSGKVDKDVVPSYTGATPTKPESETETFTFKGWDKEVVAATENATYTAQFEATQKVVTSGPVITISGNTTEFTVSAGEELTLPTVTAKNYLEEDLTEDIEIEDSMGETSIHRGVFSSLIAGVHEIEYYVEDDYGEDSETITVTVTPATPETTIGSGHSKDYHALAQYGVYEENFEDGIKSSAMSTLVDSKKAGFITATDEAIQGNSFVFNTRAIYGSAEYALFFLTIPNELKGVQVNYNISFDYKKVYRLEEGQTKEQLDAAFNGLYFSPSYDAGSSIGKDTKLAFNNADANGVYHFEESYDHFNFDTEGNAYLRFFNHFGNASDPGLAFNNTYLAIDNIVVEAIEVPQIAYSVPTAEELMADDGFVWDFKTHGGNFSNSTYVAKENIADSTIKEEISADLENFPGDVIRVTGANSHNFTGLTSTNIITGKILDVTIYYYAVNESFVVLLMNGNGSGNPEVGNPANAEVVSGNIKKLQFSYQAQGKADGFMNIYGLSANADIYVGKVEVKMHDYVPPQEEIAKPAGKVPTLAELQAGYTWDQSAENMMDANNTTYINNSAIGNETVKNAIAANTTGFGANSIRFKGGKFLGITVDNVEEGKNLVVEFDYYNLGSATPQFLILMGVDDANNETQSSSVMKSTVIDGEMRHMAINVAISSNVLANPREDKAVLNFYGSSPDWYIGKITAKLETPISEEEHIAATGSAPSLETVMAAGADGFVFDMHSNGEKFASKTATPVTGIKDATVKAALAASSYVVDGYVIHTSAADGQNVQFNGINTTNAPTGKDIKIEMVYYAVADSTHKLVSGHGVGTIADLGNGFKKWSYSVANNSEAVQYISFYLGEFDVYVCSVTLAVTEAQSVPGVSAKGYEVGDIITLCASGEGLWSNKNGYVTSAFDSGIEINPDTMPGLGTAPKKVVMDGGNIQNYTEICQVNQLEAGVKYKFKLALYNVDGYSGNLYLFDGGQTFLQLQGFTGVGYHEATVEFTFASAPGWMCFYTNTPNESGTLYVGALTAEVLEINQ